MTVSNTETLMGEMRKTPTVWVDIPSIERIVSVTCMAKDPIMVTELN